VLFFNYRQIRLQFTWLVAICLSACSFRENKVEKDEVSLNSNKPPAYIQKAWNARYDYDTERRLLVPKYAGSRWGAVQQYKEDGRLEYQDWWVRDLQVEELSAAPNTLISTFIDEDGNLTKIDLEQLRDDQSVEISEEEQEVFIEDDESEPIEPIESNDPPLDPFSPFGP
jgi:hypothetical protein